MDILREFLEVSTIHGLAYISTAKVSLILPDKNFWIRTIRILLSDKVCKAVLAWNCVSWFYQLWDPDWEVVQRVAGQTYRHHDHYPCHP